MTNKRFPVLATVGVVAWVALMGCHHGKYLWVDDYKDPANSPDKGYVITGGDLLNIRVWNQESMSAKVRVRNDGKVSLPFLNDVEAAGYTPPVLAAQLQTRLKDFINTPVVTVSLEEAKSFPIPVMGEVPKAGVYPLEPGAGVLQALASAGGLTDYASRDRIYVLRQVPAQPTPLRIRFTYEALSRAEGQAATFRLKPGDVVVVE